MMKVVAWAACLAGAAAVAQAQQPSFPPGPSYMEVLHDQQHAAEVRIQELKTKLTATQALLDKLRTIYKENHPGVISTQKKAQELLVQIAEMQMSLGATNYQVRAARMAPPERWWRNPATAKYLGLSGDQQKKLDDNFEQYRLRLTELDADLERQEILLEPMVEREPLDEGKITAQIDRVAQARAKLEKEYGRMLFGIRQQLTQEQWDKMNQAYERAPGRKTAK